MIDHRQQPYLFLTDSRQMVIPYNDYFQIVMKDDAGTIFDIFGENIP